MRDGSIVVNLRHAPTISVSSMEFCLDLAPALIVLAFRQTGHNV